MRKVVTAVAVTAATVVTELTLSVTPASAHRADVTCAGASDGESYAWVICSHPGPAINQYQVVILCTDGRLHTGPWYAVNSGNRSYAYCPTNTFLVDWSPNVSEP